MNEEIVPDDFGVLLTQENIEDHLIKVNNEKKNWEQKNPDIVKKIEDL